MFHYIRLFMVCFGTIISFCPCDILAEYDQQPKIVTQNGNLVVEAAVDRNITLRLTGDSSLFVNNVNIMERIRPRYNSDTVDDNGSKLKEEITSIDELKTEIQELHDDLERFASRMMTTQNRTRRLLQLGVIRRNMGRINRLNGRLLVLERKLKQDECAEATEPCKNGGTCYDSYNGFYCECTEGYTGNTCEEDVDECYLYAGTDLGCQNNALCINTPGSYKCHCAKGFSGTHCRLKNAVCHQSQFQELCGHGSCINANNKVGYTCLCDQGWKRNTTFLSNATTLTSPACDVDVNECEESHHPCHSECINLPGSFKCGPCPAGYTGNGITCFDVDECATNNGGCSALPKVRCINTEGSYICGNCPPGWIGDGRTCDLAPSNSCNDQHICHPQAKCEYISEVVSCTCPPGMFGHGFGPLGCHTNPLTDSCANHICQNNGTCVSLGRTTSCICPSGYSGALCETADGCHPNPCQNGGSCKPVGVNGFKCSCLSGTTGKHCEVLRSVCAKTLRIPTGELKYPADDVTEYSFNERCAWIIRTTPTQILNVTFSKFDVEQSEDCTRDWLQIHDGNSLASQLIGRFCGTDLPLGGNILSSHHLLFFWFRSDNATNRAGFEMSWISQPHVCGENIEATETETGVIKSPGYPGKTPMNRECVWQLSAPYGQRFVLRIYEVNLGSLPNCTGDSLLVSDADFMLKKFCQSSKANVFRSSANKISIHLHTDHFKSDSSFQLHYEVEPGLPHCGGIFTEPFGYIIGPSEQATCLYLIQQPPGTQIKWEFTDFTLFDIINCNLNSIEIFNGKTVEDPRIFITCGEQAPDPVTSTSNNMLVRYKNSLVDETKGNNPLKAKYSRVCEFRVFGPDSGVLSTPNYPQAYLENITCTFRIYGPSDSVVLVNFTDFSIAESTTFSTNDDTKFINNNTEAIKFNDDSITYVDIFLSSTNKRRYYKGSPMVLRSERNVMTVVFHATTNSVRARGLRFDYQFENIECGGVYTQSEGPIDRTTSGDLCVIIFEAPEARHVKLDLEVTVFEDVGEFLIYANQTAERDLLLKNITKSAKIQETFSFNTITLLLKSRMKISGSYEFVNTPQACSGNYSTLYGIIISPSWPRPYPANLDCVWIITAPLGNKIELQMHNFTLEPTCSGDKLEIRNGMFPDSPLIGSYCANQIPSRLVSFTNSLYLRFTTDNYIEGSGFYFNWEQTITGCGGKLNSYKGSIHTPHFDMQPEVMTQPDINLVCDWQIVVSQGSSIDLTVTTALDELEFCRKNNLKIYDGSTTLSQLISFNCSNILKGQHLKLTSSGNELLIVYSLTQESNHVTPEFIVDYVTNCKAIIDKHRGIVESPNFPKNYPENQDCAWELKAGRNNKWQLMFSHLSVESLDTLCDYDYVEVWDMKDLDILKKHHLCVATAEPIVSEGNRLIIHFVTDYSNNRNGFRAEYNRLGCGQYMSSEFGHFRSPNYPYSNDLDCDWFIEVQPGKQIVLIVNDFHIEADNPECKENFLTLKETKNSNIELAKECHEQQVPLKITSPGNRLLIHFHTSSTRSRKYFKASYYTRNSICGGILTGSSGIITSANYPHSHIASSYNCIWDINVPESYGILLNFKHFQLGESPNCTDASMEFSTASGVSAQYLGIFCGTEKPNIKLVHSNHLYLEYKDNGKQNLGIFAIEYKKQCGGPITKSSGYIKSLATEECVWEFDVSPGTLISLNILQMDCYCRQNSVGLKVCQNGLGFKENHFDYNLQTGNYTMYLCEQHQTDLVFEITKLHIFANNINFRAKYSTTQHSCGGHIKSSRGSLASPYYPSTYPPNVDCSWTLEASKGSFLQLQFDLLDIVKTELCNEDYLEIRDWSEGRVIGVYCGANKPQETLVSYERFWLRFHSGEGNIGNGFKISWNYAHLNELVNLTKGYIESPPIKMVQNDEEPYAWRIITQRGEFIQIGFEEYNKGLKLFDGYDETALLVDIPPSPWRFVSSSNVVYLQTDNDDGNFEKFRLLWNITYNKPLDANATLSKCHAEEFVNVHRYNAIRVTSPGYPRGYANNLYCDWIFKPLNAIEHVAVALINVDLETMGNCASDYLKISTSVDLITWQKREQLCNNSNSKVDKSGVFQWVKEASFLWVHGTPHVKLEFVTDISINGTGFLAKVVAKCGSNMTDSVGFIAGNRFTDFYDSPNSQCIWHVSVKPTKRIRVQLDYPKLTLDKQDFNEECSTHALIYDGIDDHAPLLMPGKLCYPQNITTIILNSTTNHLTIKYNLNLAETSPHLMMFWNLTYREYSECSEEIRLIPEAPEVIVTSPAYPNVPQPHTECNWRILAPQGELIEIKFIDRFDMNVRYCAQEYIELFDGSTPLSNKLGRYCHKPKPLKTTQNMLYIHYLTDIAEPRNGFKAAISISKCGGLFTENYGLITSPNYPASYPSSSQCDYIIHLWSKSLLRITIVDMHLPYNETSLQTSDHLEIITVTSSELNIPPTIVYGNATQKTKFQFASNKIIVRFHTFFKAHNYRGFKLDYFADTSYCSHIVTGVSGEITMYLPAKSHYQNTCTWKITVPKNQRVRLEFLNMADIKQQIPQTPLLFSIYNNFDATSEITAFTSSNFNASAVIQSSDNLMYLRIMMPKSDLILSPLKARYTSEDESPCPPDITSDNNSGTIDIPGASPVFQKNFYCGIKLKLGGSETIVFNISTLSSSGYGIMGMLQYPLVFKDNYASIHYRNNLTNYLHAQSQATGAVLIVQNALSRIQKLKITYRKYACGGVINIPAGGEIKYPEINSLDNDKQITCVWSLLKPFLLYTDEKNNEFKLIGNLSFTQSCENEYLEIIEGQWSNRTAALKVCRDKNNNQNYLEYLIKRNIIVTYNSLVFDNEKPSFTLTIKRNIICSSETMVNSLSSTIKIDQSSYKNNQECSWIFYTKPGLYLQVKFLGRFFIENSANCSKDYLEFQKNNGGLWIPEARFCGRETPGLYNSSSSRLQIVFRTDDAVTADGFQFVVQTHCRLVVNVSSTQPQVIESPYNHFERWRNMQCEYIFQSNETAKLMVVKTRFETGMMLYGRDLCRFGTLKVIKRYENGTDQPAISHCELAFEERAYQYLHFSYNSYVPLRFTMEYGFDTCGGNVTSPTVIRALKHELENSYADNMNCIWYITAPPDHSIAVRFKYFSTEEVYDHLSIYSGALVKAEKLVARLSGNYTATAPIVVDSNQAVITAISDSSTSDGGFEAQIIFTANCNERLTLTEGNSPVTLTRYIKFNSSEEYICNYRITAPTSYRIRIEIKKLQINNANSTCQDSLQNCKANCNFLEISDNSMGYQEAFFDKLCASSSINRTFVSSYEFALIRLNAHKPGQYSFEIILRMEKTACGLTEYKLGENEKYKFTYPLNGLAKYESNIHCKWHLRASHELQFHFNYIDLQNKSQVTGKCVDYIHLKDLYYSHHLCGHSENFTINTINFANNKIALTFHSDESIEGKGFEFIAQRADTCNRTYNFLSKNIAYTGYGKEDLICNDTIIVSINYTLNFYISSLYLKDYDCTKLHFKITDLHTNKTLLDRCHNSYTDVNLFTTTNAVRIEAADFNSINLDYAASDRNLTPGCGGTFTANKAQFCSPPYENRNFSECHWNIKIPSTSVKTIRFLDFNMGAITNCHLDNVKIIEVLPDGKEKLLETFCGPDVPGPLTSTSDHLIIISKKSPNFDGTGWTLSYDASNYEVNPTVYVNNYLE